MTLLRKKKTAQTLLTIAVLSASASALAVVPINGRVSRGFLGVQSNGGSYGTGISGDGRFVAFASEASNLTFTGDSNGVYDVFLHDRLTGLVTPISLGPNRSFLPSPPGPVQQGSRLWSGGGARNVSAEGRYVLFYSDARLTTDDVDDSTDVFVRDTFLLGSTRLVSRATGANGAQSADFDLPVGLSADGRYAFFMSSAQLDPADDNNEADVFRRDLTTNTTLRITEHPDGGVGSAAISRDGRYLVYSTEASLSASDQNAISDVYLRDTQLNTDELVSVDESGSASGGANPAISGGAERVSYAPTSSFPFTGNSRIWTRATNTRTDVVVSSPDANPVSSCIVRTFSRTGRYAGVQCDHRPQGGEFPVTQAFYLDVQTGSSGMISRNASGAEPNSAVSPDSVSDDGSVFTATSTASDLVPFDTNGKSDAFIMYR